MRRLDTSRVRVPGTNLRGWRAIAVLALAVYIVVFIIVNDRKIHVDFVFFSVRSNELIALLLVVILSFAVGLIVGGRRAQRKQQPPPD